jgi:glycosyltransferase involved in cell wall biosynthesis
MVFLDVTDACKSARNTGIERTTRKIFAGLKERLAVTPLCWNTIDNRYHEPGPRELENLQAPFRTGAAPSARPELQGAGPFAEIRRLFASRAIDLKKQLHSADVFLMPDIYRDGRLRVLPAIVRETATRTVAIFHDAAALSLPFLSRRGATRFRHYIESLDSFDLVICVSRASEKDLHRLWSESGVSSTMTCVEEWPVEFDESLRKPSSVASPNVVLCVGSLEPRKNHLTLLEAAALLCERGTKFELQIVGRSTASWGPQRVVREIAKLQSFGHTIKWLRHVNEETLHRAYRDCRFTVYPSLAEGFGLPILESLWHGKPCICGQNGALGEAGAAGGCLLVDQTNAAALAKAMNHLLGDSQLYERLCREASRREFRSWNDYFDKLLNHFAKARAPSLTGSRDS